MSRSRRSPAQREAERILRVWLHRLRLTDWDIQIRWALLPGQNADGTGEPDNDLDAEIRVHDYHEQASIRLSSKWLEWSPEVLNHTLVHELLHVYEMETKRPVDHLQSVMGKIPYEVFCGWYVAGRERWVDKLAVVLVDLAGLA